jgi:hypothetical protein
MPWCGFLGTAYWWVLPLIGLVFLGVMLFVCSRGFGCMGGWRRGRMAFSEESARNERDEVRHGCCGRQPERAPKST